MTLLAGTQLGEYEILALIGSGAMGEVYKARDVQLGREVAIKALPDDVARDPNRLARFEREARALAALSHPNIVTIHRVHVHGGVPFLVMELLEGGTLRECLLQERFSVARAIDVAADVATALAAAHARGIVHRDLKPENIVLTVHGQVKVVDFGLARRCASAAETATAAAGITMEGTIVGTPAYMAPEQVRGEAVDHRCDIFALGCVLHEMLAGHPVFAREGAAETMSAVLRDPAPELPADAGPGIAQTVQRCLEKRPERRFQSAADLAFALRALGRDPRLSRRNVDAESRFEKPSIAVLPFLNLSADPEQEYFCDGMAEEIINALAHVDGLSVVARTSSFSFKWKPEDARTIGARLGVEMLVEGSVRRSGARLRITAQLIDVSDGSHLWSERYDRKPEDVFAIQDEIALAVVDNLSVRLLGAERDAMKRRPAASLGAYDAYLKGLFYWEQLSADALARSVECFQESIRLDPGLVPSYVFLGQSLASAAYWADAEPRPAFLQAIALVEKALAIQPHCAEAQTARGIFLAYFERDWAAAVESLEAATRLAPSLAFAHLHLSGFYMLRRRSAEAIAEARVTLRLDPMSPTTSAWAACWLGFTGEVEEAVRHLERIASACSTFWMPQYLLATVLPAAGRAAEAREAAENAVRLSGGASVSIGIAGTLAYLQGDVARGDACRYELEGRWASRYVTPSALAWLEFARGHVDAARQWLERGVEASDPMLPFCVPLIELLLPHEPRVRDALSVARI